ncbi:leucine-rich repeat and guanylate kinase domain-containing protein-like [Hylaeus volcanicus]|uniref:leucine-rich repeat and guanylate kinase domain-containing protein-like n=1 Tax=Hylaeus volcanicus TaxID=313075 RepID=UPI0023B79955|nr:leucine-rich repeat and guanylate kinase domain-containing protein-like [Hylaeus volcanicus]
MDVIIRKAKREDCTSIKNLIQELADFQNMPDGPKIDHTTLEKDGFDTEPALYMCFVAERNKRIVGYTISYYTYSTWCGKAMYLEDIYVTVDYRGKHIGSKLLKAVAKEASDNNCCRLDFSVLKWNPAQDFYKRKGAVDVTIEEGFHHYRLSDTVLKSLAMDLPYLFSSTPLLLEPNATSKFPTTKKQSDEDYEELDSDILSHSDMSWGSLEDRYVPFEILSEDSDSTTSLISSTTSLFLKSGSSIVLDHMPVPVNVDAIHCANESNWANYALDPNAWDDDKARIVKLRHLKEILFDDFEFCGFLTDRLIGVGSSFLAKSPENGLYVLNKCVMKNMSLSNITMLHYHRYLRYIDLTYNYISDLSPLGGVPYLMYLNVAHNRIQIILNFTPPWYLTYVNLSYNYISEMRDISNFWSIVHLDLSHNAIEVISGLQNLKYLKYLNLSYNLIECIENLDKLNIQELNLEGNCITTFKSAVPGYNINTLPHLRVIYLGYNKISDLEFFKDGYSLRVIDLKFNRISDLLELSNFKGFIDEIDLRGNGCTKWPNYKGVLLFSIPSIQVIDGAVVTISEKIAAATLFAPPVNLTAARTVTKLTLLEHLSTPTIGLHVMPYNEASPPLIILTGPSALKKTSLVMHIVQTLPSKIKYCQWYTTKEPENDTAVHQSYIFADREDFNDMSRRGEFLAIQEQLGNSYGFHYNQITSLILENKIGITTMDLHATIQMTKRYSNVKPILVSTQKEQIHRIWIQEKFDVYTCDKSSMENLLAEKGHKTTEENISASTNIKKILDDIIDSCPLPTKSNDKKQSDKRVTMTEILESTSAVYEVKKEESKTEEKKYITFQEKETDHSKKSSLAELYVSNSQAKLNNQTELRVILDEDANVIVEDKELKRKRYQERLLHRRSTLLDDEEFFSTEDHSDSASSEETVVDPRFLETRKPEHLKELYTELVIKTREMYLNHHVNNPGFFFSVLLTDNYVKAFNTLIDFIYNVYTNHPTENPKHFTEIEHFSEVAVPAMIDTVVDEIRQSLSTSILQRKTLLRAYGITSWKDLMPSQMDTHSAKFTD